MNGTAASTDFSTSNSKPTPVGSNSIANGSTSNNTNKVENNAQQQGTPKISTKEENMAKLKSMTSDFWAQM
jgi:hypothetical protein